MAKFIPTPPRYDEIYYEGVELLDKIARGDFAMSIECYETECPKHPKDEPFCDEEKCIVDFEPENCTCSRCSEKFTCKFAGDLYNTDGDCLMDK